MHTDESQTWRCELRLLHSYVQLDFLSLSLSCLPFAACVCVSVSMISPRTSLFSFSLLFRPHFFAHSLCFFSVLTPHPFSLSLSLSLSFLSLSSCIAELFEEPELVGVELSTRQRDDVLSIWNRGLNQDARFKIGWVTVTERQGGRRQDREKGGEKEA